MRFADWVYLIGTLVLIAGVGYMWAAERRVAVKKRVLVNLDNGRTVQGVLWQRTRDLLVLRNAVWIERGREPMPMDGEVIMERRAVEFMQVP